MNRGLALARLVSAHEHARAGRWGDVAEILEQVRRDAEAEPQDRLAQGLAQLARDAAMAADVAAGLVRPRG